MAVITVRVVLSLFLRGKEKRSEGDQSIIRCYPDSFQSKTLLLTDGDHLLT